MDAWRLTRTHRHTYYYGTRTDFNVKSPVKIAINSYTDTKKEIMQRFYG